VRDGEGRTALHHAVMRGHLGAIDALTAAAGGPALLLQKDVLGCTPVHLAAVQNQVTLILKLVSALLKDEGGRTPLHVIARQRCMQVRPPPPPASIAQCGAARPVRISVGLGALARSRRRGRSWAGKRLELVAPVPPPPMVCATHFRARQRIPSFELLQPLAVARMKTWRDVREDVPAARESAAAALE